jgi:hypothetical protein
VSNLFLHHVHVATIGSINQFRMQLQSPTSPSSIYNNYATPGPTSNTLRIDNSNNSNSVSKRSSPAEIEKGTYYGMYTMPEAERNRAKQKHLNTKYPDEWAATRLVRVIVSVRMRPNIYGDESTRCTRILNPTLQYNEAEDEDFNTDNDDTDDNGSLDEMPHGSKEGEVNILDLRRSKLGKAERKNKDNNNNSKIPSVIVQTKRQKMNGAPEKKYTFDHVFAPNANQAHVYRTIASPLVDNVMSGVNACVIAYGQTGAGKTYTVFGPSMDTATVAAENASELGVIPRAAHDIFERVEMDKGKFEYKVYVTYMQIYLDQIYDLINNDNNSTKHKHSFSNSKNKYTNETRNSSTKKRMSNITSTNSNSRRKKNMNMSMSSHNKMDHDTHSNSSSSSSSSSSGASKNRQRKHPTLKIREHHGVPYVAGLSVHRVTSAHNILELLYEGTLNKIVASTSMNEASSRSHAIFQVLVEKSEVVPANGDRSKSHSSTNRNGKVLIGKLTCVDLAGSERASKTQPTGIQLREAKSINKSLCSLGNTIASLSQPNRNANKFVPWRDSKLTHLLCEALSGNSCVSLIVNIAPEDRHCPETVNSLLFGTRAKKVILNPSSNENIDYEVLSKWLQERLDITVDGLRQAQSQAKLQEDRMRQEFQQKIKAVDNVSASETELLEMTLMEQVNLNEKLAKQLKRALESSNNNFDPNSGSVIPPHATFRLNSASVGTSTTSPPHYIIHNNKTNAGDGRSTLTDAMMKHFEQTDATNGNNDQERRYSSARMEERAELESLRETVRRLNKELVEVKKSHERAHEAERSSKYDEMASLREEIKLLNEKLNKEVKKASIQSNVYKLEGEVKSLMLSDEREELMLAKSEIERLKTEYGGENANGSTGDKDRGVNMDAPYTFTRNEYEELLELRKAVELFTLEREQLIKGFAKQRAEWAKRFNNKTMAIDYNFEDKTTGEDVLELQNTLELERSSFWEIMQDTNKHIAMMKQEQDKLVLENEKLRVQLKSRHSQQIDSVEKIRSILSNRGKNSSPIPYNANELHSPTERSSSYRSPTNNSSKGSSSMDGITSVQSGTGSAKRIRVKRSGSIYID